MAKISEYNIKTAAEALDRVLIIDPAEGLPADRIKTCAVPDLTAPILDSISGAIGRINNPLVHIPLKNSLDMVCGVGTPVFTRATTATYIDRYGILQYAAVNTPRFEKEGLLFEGASENKLTYSEAFDNSPWLNGNSSVTANAAAAPDKTTTADKLYEDASANQHYIRQIQSTAAGSVTGSLFAKASGRSRLMMYLYNSTDGTIARAYFDLTAGTIHSEDIGTARIKALLADDGWYRCSISGTSTVTIDTRLYIHLVDDNWSLNYTGDGSSGLYLWGGQLENLPFASSYMPTTSSAVTRAIDLCNIAFPGNMPAPNTTEMSVLSDVEILGDNDSYQPVFRTSEAHRSLYVMSPGDVSYGYIGSASGVFGPIWMPVAGACYRFGLTTDLTTDSLYRDGGIIGTRSTLANITGSSSVIYLGGYASYSLWGHLSNFRIYDTALTAAEMRIA